MMAAADDKTGQNMNSNLTKLLFACMQTRVEDVEKMLAEEAFCMVINMEQQDGWTACHYAASAGSKEIVQMLAAHGADINAQTNRSKSTPLHLAAKRGHHRIASTLLDYCVDVNATDAHGWTATKLAKACGHDSLAQLLSLIEQRRTADRQLQIQCERVPLETQERVEGNIFKTNLGKSGVREIGNVNQKRKELDIKIQDFDKQDCDEESIKYQTKSTFGALPESRYSPPQAHISSQNSGIAASVAEASKKTVKVSLPKLRLLPMYVEEESSQTIVTSSRFLRCKSAQEHGWRSSVSSRDGEKEKERQQERADTERQRQRQRQREEEQERERERQMGWVRNQENIAPDGGYNGNNQGLSRAASAGPNMSNENSASSSSGSRTSRPTRKDSGTGIGLVWEDVAQKPKSIVRRSSPPRPATGKSKGVSVAAGRKSEGSENATKHQVTPSTKFVKQANVFSQYTNTLSTIGAVGKTVQPVNDVLQMSTPKGIPRLHAFQAKLSTLRAAAERSISSSGTRAPGTVGGDGARGTAMATKAAAGQNSSSIYRSSSLLRQ